jgi:conserved domain protein
VLYNYFVKNEIGGDRMKFNNSKLRGKIRENFGSEYAFGEALGMALSTLSGKLNNKSEFTRSEILSIVKLLNLKKEEIYDVFFCLFSS